VPYNDLEACHILKEILGISKVFKLLSNKVKCSVCLEDVYARILKQFNCVQEIRPQGSHQLNKCFLTRGLYFATNIDNKDKHLIINNCCSCCD